MRKTIRTWMSGVPRSLWVVLFLGLCVRIYGIDFGLPLHLHPDEWSQVDLAGRVLEGHLNPGFFRYPSFMIYLLALILAVLKIAGAAVSHGFSQETSYLAGRVLSALFGAAAVLPVFYMARRMGSVRTGITAAALVSLSPELVRQSHYATVDGATTFWILAALALALAVRWGDLRSFLPSGLAAGLALSTKYSAIYVLPAIFGLMAWEFWRRPTAQRALSVRSRSMILLIVNTLAAGGLALLPEEWVIGFLQHWTTDGVVEPEYSLLLHRLVGGGIMITVAAGILGFTAMFSTGASRIVELVTDPRFVLFGICILLVFALTSPFVLLDPAESVRDIAYEYRHVSIGSAAHFRLGDPVLEAVKNEVEETGRGFYWNWWISQNGWPLLLAFGAGLVVAGRKDGVSLCVLLVPLLLLSISLTFAGNKAARYALLIPPLTSILASASLSGGILGRSRKGLLLHAIATTSLLITPATVSAGILRSEFNLPDTRTRAFLWIKDHVPPGSTLVREAYTPDIEAVLPRIVTVRTTGAFEERSLEEWRVLGATYFLIGRQRDWYTTNSRYYPSIQSQYRSLDSTAALAAEFHADAACMGPPVWIYRLER
jgi:4-amino-4-deoxy-L-arabinose transferase-like glycosyltransferase